MRTRKEILAVTNAMIDELHSIIKDGSCLNTELEADLCLCLRRLNTVKDTIERLEEETRNKAEHDFLEDNKERRGEDEKENS